MAGLFQRPSGPDEHQVAQVRAAAVPLSDGADEYDELLRRIGSARIVLLGEASHGTHEFYEARARITMRLVTERGFDAVAIEGDWPDAARVNRHVRGLGRADVETAADALAGFRRFPTWMWRNTMVVDLVDQLRDWNLGLLHATGLPRFLLPLLERAIGVIYRPDTERQSHYFHAQVAQQFDALVHIDRTRAVVPMEADEPWTSGHAAHAAEAAETYPQGL